MRVSEKELRGLIGPVESVQTNMWFIAEHYRIVQGQIYADGWRCRQTLPLSDPNLFLSFARLGAHGEPSERLVWSWVSKHGLLTREDYDRWLRTKEKRLNQATMKLQEFRAEVHQAYDALTLFQQIRGQNCDALRNRIGRNRIYLRNPPPNWPSRYGRTARAIVTLDGQNTPIDWLADGELSDDDIVSLSVRVLEHLVEQKIHDYGVTLSFRANFDHPRPLSPSGGYGFSQYRPQLTPMCPDLRSALWYQFGTLISDKRPLLNCEQCGLPFVGRRHAKTCSDACRKGKSRRTRESKGDS